MKNRCRMPNIGFMGSRLAHSVQNSTTNPMESIPGPSFGKKKTNFSKIGVDGRGEAQKCAAAGLSPCRLTACQITANVVLRAMHD